MPGTSGGGTDVSGENGGGETSSEIGGLDVGEKQGDNARGISDNSENGFQVVHNRKFKGGSVEAPPILVIAVTTRVGHLTRSSMEVYLMALILPQHGLLLFARLLQNLRQLKGTRKEWKLDLRK